MARQLIAWTLTLSIAGQNDETWKPWEKPLEKPLENERKKPGCCGFPTGFSIRNLEKPWVSSLGHPVFVAVATLCAWMHWVPATRCDQPLGTRSDF